MNVPDPVVRVLCWTLAIGAIAAPCMALVVVIALGLRSLLSEIEPGSLVAGLAGPLAFSLVAAAVSSLLGVLLGVCLHTARSSTMGGAGLQAARALTSAPALLIGVAISLGAPSRAAPLLPLVALLTVMTPAIALQTSAAIAAVPPAIDEAGVALGLSRARVTLGLLLRTAAPSLLPSLLSTMLGALADPSIWVTTAPADAAVSRLVAACTDAQRPAALQGAVAFAAPLLVVLLLGGWLLSGSSRRAQRAS